MIEDTGPVFSGSTVHASTLDELSARIQARSANAIVMGPAKIGKTIFLRSLERKLCPSPEETGNFVVTYVDCRQPSVGWDLLLAPLLNRLVILRFAYEEVDRQAIDRLEKAHAARPEEVASFVSEALTIVTRCEPEFRVVWLYDHFDSLLQSRDETSRQHLAGLLRLIKERMTGVAFVVAIASALPKELMPYFEPSYRVELSLPTEEAAKKLAAEVLHRPAEDRLVRRVMDMAGYHPYYVDTLCRFITLPDGISKWRREICYAHLGSTLAQVSADQRSQIIEFVSKGAIDRSRALRITLEDIRRPIAGQLERKALVFREDDLVWLPGKALHRYLSSRDTRLSDWPAYDQIRMDKLVTVFAFVFGVLLLLSVVIEKLSWWLPFLVWTVPLLYGIYGFIIGQVRRHE